MNREEASKLLPILDAFVKGETVEYKYKAMKDASWKEIENPTFEIANFYYRIKQAPKLRPWKPEEVPVGALIRHSKQHKNCISLITGKTASGLAEYTATWESSLPRRAIMLDEMLELEHSLDHGKTWLPCGVLE